MVQFDIHSPKMVNVYDVFRSTFYYYSIHILTQIRPRVDSDRAHTQQDRASAAPLPAGGSTSSTAFVSLVATDNGLG